jgi:hypothetical protein
LGRHVPITKVLRDGILKVGKKYADKLTNENADPWFEMIGESSSALLLKLYSQVRTHVRIEGFIDFFNKFQIYVGLSALFDAITPPTSSGSKSHRVLVRLTEAGASRENPTESHAPALYDQQQ